MQFSSPIDANVVRKALLESEALYTAADCGMSYLALANKCSQVINGESGDKNEFWFHAYGALRGSFVINWCKLFGVDVKDIYWKQVTLEQKAFREAVYAATGFDYQQWDHYRKSMSDLRAVMVEHLNPYHPIDTLPDFAPALAVIKVCQQWLGDVCGELAVEKTGPLGRADYFQKVAADIEVTLQQINLQ